MYHCISDRYDPGSGHYDSLEDFLAMCRACFGEAPELQQDGESYRDDQGIVLEPAPEMAEYHRRCEARAMRHPHISEHEHLPAAAHPLAEAWADSWGAEELSVSDHADRLHEALDSAGCTEIRWYDGLVCWRTAAGDAGHLQLTRTATHGVHRAARERLPRDHRSRRGGSGAGRVPGV